MNRSALHIVLGGVENGDKRWLERASRHRLAADRWVVPKTAMVGDDVVIHIPGYGLFATASVATLPKPRSSWYNRYGAGLKSIRLIDPPISLDILRRRLPALRWTVYPRSITTPRAAIAEKLQALIRDRRRHHAADIDEKDLAVASLLELLARARARAAPRASARQRHATERLRATAIKKYALVRADGRCEFCKKRAPFQTANGEPYLESHHVLRLADEGPDHPRNVIGVCPNCHRRAHFAHDRKKIKAQMKRRAAVLFRQSRAGG